MTAKPKTASNYAFCLDNNGYSASLEPRKIYLVLPDEDAQSKKMLRVIDESGEDYLYPAKLFVTVELPPKAKVLFKQAA